MTAQMQPTNKAATSRPIAGRPPLPMQMALTPKEILGILRRHVLLIVAFTVLGAILGTGAWFLLREYFPRYKALGAIQILQPAITDPLEISDAQTNKDIYDQFRNSKILRMRSLGSLQELLRRDNIRGTKWFKQFVKGNETNVARSVKILQRRLHASAPRDDVHVLVSMTTSSAAESKLIVNEMLNLFLAQQRDEATFDLRNQLVKRRAQQEKLRDDLEVSNDEMRRIQEGTDFGNLGQTSFQDYLSRTLGEQQTDLGDLENDITRLISTVEILKARAEGPYDEVVTEQIEQDPVARRMRDSIAMLEPLLAELLTRFGENHIRVKQVSDSLKQRHNDLRKRQVEIANILRDANYRNARDAVVTMTVELESQRARLQEIQAQHKEMNKVRADYLDAVTRHDEKQERLKEMTTHIHKLTTLLEDPQLSKVKIAWRAPEPLEMSFPKLILFLPGGFILGLLAGLGLTFAIELLNDLVRSPSDVVRHLQAPLLGMICHVDEDPEVSSADLAHVVRRVPYSIMSECYRQFRANLKHSGRDEDKKILLITSGAAGDGKTTIAANLATTLIAENCKVLLIDANFRRSMTVTLFPGTNGSPPDRDWCLSNYLTGQCQVDNGLVRSSGIENFDIIDSGPVPASPAEMLGSTAMRDLLARYRDVYDYIIIDSPPLLVSDAKALAVQADGTILVFDAETTHRGAAQRALRELREINATVVGTVLMRVKAMKGGYFQEIYKSYQKYQRSSSLQPVAQ